MIQAPMPNWRLIVLGVLLLAAVVQFGSAGRIAAKAYLAQGLIASAWQRSLESGGSIEKPWPWADTWPVARLEVPRFNVDLFVLWGAQGNALAFGPGLETASASPGKKGATVIGGHRDTHFKFLQNVQLNTLLSLQLANGESIDYLVSDVRVVDTSSDPYLRVSSNNNELVLVTCYPFNALAPGGPLRFLVTARKVLRPGGHTSQNT